MSTFDDIAGSFGLLGERARDLTKKNKNEA
jgi:hypothetical protein